MRSADGGRAGEELVARWDFFLVDMMTTTQSNGLTMEAGGPKPGSHAAGVAIRNFKCRGSPPFSYFCQGPFWPLLALVFLAAAALCPGLAAAAPLPNFDLYHTTKQLFDSLHSLAALRPDMVRVSYMSERYFDDKDHEPVQVLTVTDFGTKLSDNHKEKVRVLFVAGEHGRELITSEILAALVHKIAAATDPAISRAEVHEPLGWFSSFLRNVRLTVVPVLNPFSRKAAERGDDLCSRRNEHGVDLNRNWDFMFGKHPDPALRTPTSDQYPGAHAFSEPQTRALRDLAIKLRPHLYVNVHSDIEEMYYGWDHAEEAVPNADLVEKLLAHLSASYAKCNYGVAGRLGGYRVFGSSMDFLYDVVGVPFALTMEVFGSPGDKECFPMFNPVGEEAFRGTLEKWTNTLLLAPMYFVGQRLGLAVPLPTQLSATTDVARSCRNDKRSLFCSTGKRRTESTLLGPSDPAKDRAAHEQELAPRKQHHIVGMDSPAYLLSLFLPLASLGCYSLYSRVRGGGASLPL